MTAREMRLARRLYLAAVEKGLESPWDWAVQRVREGRDIAAKREAERKG